MGVEFMETTDKIGCVEKILTGFPGVVIRTVTNPLDEIKDIGFLSIESRIQVQIHFILRGTVKFNIRWRSLFAPRNIRFDIGFNQRYVKYVMESTHIWRKV